MITISFTGHRPDKLGGYDWNTQKNIKIMKSTYIAIAHAILKSPNIFPSEIDNILKSDEVGRLITGGSLGFDQMAFYVGSIIREKIKSIKQLKLGLAIPCKNQECKWIDQNDIVRYYNQIKAADEIWYIDELIGTKYEFKKAPIGSYHPYKMQLRNEFMVDNADFIISCWDETKGGTFNCIEYAKTQNKPVYNINPNDFI